MVGKAPELARGRGDAGAIAERLGVKRAGGDGNEKCERAVDIVTGAGSVTVKFCERAFSEFVNNLGWL